MKEKQKNKKHTNNQWKNSGFKLSRELRDIIHGYVMSDGYLRNGILTVDQGQKQKSFVLWLYQKLEPLRSPAPIKEVRRIHPKNQKLSRSFRFFTRAVLQGFQHMWYQQKVYHGVSTYEKKLPITLACFFNETFLTLWFAGDGTKTLGSIGAKFEVTSLTVEERHRLKKLFLSKFEIEALLLKAGNSSKGRPQWVLKIPAKEYPKFRKLITMMDLISNVFPYKLHKKPKL